MMTESDSNLNWSTELFVDCYNSIRFQDEVSYESIQILKKDLFSILITPPQSESSRNKLIDESKPVVFSNGEEFKLNREFVEASVILSAELNLNEIVSAEILYHANKLSFQKGTSFNDSARLAYFSRLKYILNIDGYLISNEKLQLIIGDKYEEFFDNLLKSFEKIYEILGILNDLIDKQKVTNDINNLSFINSVNYIKSQLFSDHEILGQIYYSLMDNYFDKYGKPFYYSKVVTHITKHLNDEDLLIVHYMPGLLKFVTDLPSLTDDEVMQFYKQTTTNLSNDYAKVVNNESIDLSRSSLKGFEIVVSLIFFTCFIPWCKQSKSRTDKFDFKKDILKYIEWCINYGVMERLLSFTADTANSETQVLLEWSNLYDFRSLLQKTYPRLSPMKFIYPNSTELINASNLKPGFENVHKLIDLAPYKISSDFNEALLAPFFHIFFSEFINNAALVLTSLRDSEEDFLLSSINRKQLEISNGNDEDNNKDKQNVSNTKLSNEKFDGNNECLDLDEISTRSDLERFYLAFVYTYSNRPELCSLFWPSDESSNDLIGFITWGLSNNTSPLITATFCLLLGSLTSSGDEAALKIWEILVGNNNSTLKKNDYSKVSIDSIIDSLNYYIDALNENFEQDLDNQIKQQQKRQEFLFSSNINNQESEESSLNKIIIELAEDSLVFISGFIQLITSIVKNLSSSNERSKEIKNIAFNRFNPVITGFLKFDNLVKSKKNVSIQISSSASNNKSNGSSNVLVNEDNRVILVNLLLKFLSDFISGDDSLSIRYKIWGILDRWIYQSLTENDSSYNNSVTTSLAIFHQLQSKPKYPNKRAVRINQGFQINLTHLSSVGNFIKLLSHLLKPLNIENQAFTSYKLLYPADLGANYRNNNQIGIWPYIEYVLLEVFSKSEELTNFDDKYNLQLLIIEIIENSLNEIDWVFINDIAPKVINNLHNLDSIVDSLLPDNPINYQSFIRLHHSLAILNYLFDEKCYKTLFKIINVGLESINRSEKLSLLVEKSLEIVNKILELQDTFINRLLPILKNDELGLPAGASVTAGFGTSMSLALTTPRTIFDNIYYPKNIGTNGIHNFFEIFLFNLSTIAHFALYVGCSNMNIANSSIEILNKISSSKFFVSKIDYNSNDPLLTENRLLTTFESIDESVKIKYSFIEQFENFYDDLDIKFNILQFLLDNLEQSNGKKPTVSHFLLGYEIRGDNLFLNESSRHNSLLISLLNSLKLSLDLISEIDYNNGNNRIVDIGPAKLSSLILEIIVKLCRDPISSIITLNYLRNYDELFEKLISYQPKIDSDTIWYNHKFNGDLQDNLDNEFIQDNLSSQALFSFIKHRNLTLQYFSLEFHNITSITKKEYYIKLLLNNKEFLNGSPKILNFLDILNFKFKNFELYKYEGFEKRYDLSLILEQIKFSKEQDLDLSILNKIYKLICQTSKSASKELKVAFSKEIMNEGNKVSEFLTKYIVFHDLKDIQLKCLHSWCQLIEILITDSNINSKNFILEIFQVILPRINDYLESDILFSEELISLSVLLFALYEQEILLDNKDEEFIIGIQRLIPLFKTCINGILNSNSTITFRSDLYLLANKFLSKTFNSEELVNQLSVIIKSVDKKFIDTICNDSIYSDGSSRITSILFLESLIHLSSSNKVNFILDLLIKNNSLLLLVRSIKRTDEMLTICSNENSGINLDYLLYELTAFKSTLYFLIRVAQSKLGSLQLIQSDLFSILKQSNFLKIDPDLGLNLKIKEIKDFKSIKIKLVLDTPLSLNELNDSLSDENNISYFEFLVPIFQLIATILLSMGPSYKPSIIQVKELLQSFNKLIVGIMKRDLLIESDQVKSSIYKPDSISLLGLKELVKLFTLLDSLVNYEKKE